MFVVDTNVLLYAAERSFAEHAKCRSLLLEWRQQPTAWYTTWGILYEFVRVATHPRAFRSPWPAAKAWSFVESLLASPSHRTLKETEQHTKATAQILAALPDLSGNIIHDLHTVALMREHGVSRIYTRDTDFHRFTFLEVLDPMV